MVTSRSALATLVASAQVGQGDSVMESPKSSLIVITDFT